MKFIGLLMRYWLLVVFIIATSYVAVVNGDETLSFQLPPLLNNYTLRVWEFFGASFLVGVTLTVFFFGIEYSRKSLEVRRLRKQLKELDTLKQPSNRTAVAENRPSTNHEMSRQPTRISDPLS